MTQSTKPAEDHLYVSKEEFLEMVADQYTPAEWTVAVERGAELTADEPLPFRVTSDFNRYEHTLDDGLRHRFGFTLQLPDGVFLTEQELATIGRDDLLNTYTEVGELTESFGGHPAGTPAIRLLTFAFRGAESDREHLLIQTRAGAATPRSEVSSLGVEPPAEPKAG